jgi:hypothetical protein
MGELMKRIGSRFTEVTSVVPIVRRIINPTNDKDSTLTQYIDGSFTFNFCGRLFAAHKNSAEVLVITYVLLGDRSESTAAIKAAQTRLDKIWSNWTESGT